MKRKLGLMIATSFLSTVLTGCAGLMGESVFSGDKGRVLISADEAGMRAWSDMITGSAIVGKASPDTVDAHTQMRFRQDDTTRLKWAARWAKTPAGVEK